MSDKLRKSNLREVFLWIFGRRSRFRVTGDSMSPQLDEGAEVLVNPGAYRAGRPQPGDIVVALHPYQSDFQVVKRVASVTADGRYLLQGDNLAKSTDSRSFGPISFERIIGQVTCRLW